MIRFSIRSLTAIASSLFCLASTAHALNLELTQGVDSAIPMAIYAFSPKMVDGQTMPLTSIISNDLTMSGHFAVTPMAYDANANMMSASQVQQWQQSNITDVVMGSITKEMTGNYAVQVQLMDVPTQAVLWHHTYHVPVTQFRNVAHQISNHLFEKLTGIAGVFTTKIAYVHVLGQAPGSKRYRLEVADMDGFDPQVIVDSAEPIMSPAWSPNGKQIAYVSFENHQTAIYVQNLNDGSRVKLSDQAGINAAPTFSPDGKSIAMVQIINGYPHIVQQNIDTGKTQILTSGYSYDTEPAYSPDGQTMLFTSTRNSGFQLYQLNLATQAINRLTFNGNYNASGAYFPNNKAIAFVHQKNQMMTIAKQSLKGYQAPSVLDAGLEDASPSIAPNGDMIVYSQNFQGHRILATVSMDGQAKSRLPATVGSVQDPAWSPFLKHNNGGV